MGMIQNLNLEGAINKISYQPFIYDFLGFRHITLDSVLAEGALDSTITNLKSFRFGGKTTDKQTNVSARQLWSEFSGTTQPSSCIQIENAGHYRFEGVMGIAPTSPVKLIGDDVMLQLCNFSSTGDYDFYTLFDFGTSNANVEIEGAQLRSLRNIPIKNNSMLGKIKLKNATSYVGTEKIRFSIGDIIETYKHKTGFLKDNKFVTFNKKGISNLTDIEIVNDADEGRVLKFSNSTNINMPSFGGTVNIPTDLIGSDLVIAIRYKIETTDTASITQALAASTTSFNSRTNILNIKNQWASGYMVIRNAQQNIAFYASASSHTLPHTLYISDVVISFGNTLPLIKGKVGATESIKTQGTLIPITGTWVKGDIIYNTNPNAGGFIGWICTVSGTPGTWKGFGLIEA